MSTHLIEEWLGNGWTLCCGLHRLSCRGCRFLQCGRATRLKGFMYTTQAKTLEYNFAVLPQNVMITHLILDVLHIGDSVRELYHCVGRLGSNVLRFHRTA